MEGKACSSCGESIPVTAVLCSKCKSYQDWRRWIPLSETTLALLTAFISVLTVGSAPFLQLLWSPNSKMSATFQSISAERNAITFAVVNTGGRPGSVAGAWLVTNPEDPDSGLFAEQLNIKGGYLPPYGDGQLVITASPEDGEDAERRIAESAGDCEISVRLVEFDGSTRDVNHREACSTILRTLFGTN